MYIYVYIGYMYVYIYIRIHNLIQYTSTYQIYSNTERATPYLNPSGELSAKRKSETQGLEVHPRTNSNE